MKKKMEYWFCLIGQYDVNSYKAHGADYPLRMAVRDKFIDLTGKDCDVCASGWGIDQKRYEILSSINLISTDELEKILNNYRQNNEK